MKPPFDPVRYCIYGSAFLNTGHLGTCEDFQNALPELRAVSTACIGLSYNQKVVFYYGGKKIYWTWYLVLLWLVGDLTEEQ